MFSFRPMISRNVADWVRRSHGAALWLVARMVERPLAYPSLCIHQPDLIVVFISVRNSVLLVVCFTLLVFWVDSPTLLSQLGVRGERAK